MSMDGDVEGADGPSKLDRVATVEEFKEKEKGIMAISPQQEDINKPEPKVSFKSSEFISPPPVIP